MNTHLIKQTPIIMGMNAVYVCPVCKNYVLITSAVQDTDGLMKHEQCTRVTGENVKSVRCKMRNVLVIMLFLSILLLMIMSFVLGRRFESYSIRNSIQKNGMAISQWGDTSRIKIIGTVEDI
jgi:hypothetical protein